MYHLEDDEYVLRRTEEIEGCVSEDLRARLIEPLFYQNPQEDDDSEVTGNDSITYPNMLNGINDSAERYRSQERMPTEITGTGRILYDHDLESDDEDEFEQVQMNTDNHDLLTQNLIGLHLVAQ